MMNLFDKGSLTSTQDTEKLVSRKNESPVMLEFKAAVKAFSEKVKNDILDHLNTEDK